LGFCYSGIGSSSEEEEAAFAKSVDEDVYLVDKSSFSFSTYLAILSGFELGPPLSVDMRLIA
jgi:hypothetical protein